MASFDSQNVIPLDDRKEYHYRRDGTVFLIDSTVSSFQTNEEDVPYFKVIIQEYIKILREKLLWNKSDWMGIILFGTKEWDKNPEVKNVLTIQDFSAVTLQKLKQAMEIENGGWQKYKDIACENEYPLCDALVHAIYMFTNVNISMPVRRVVLLTCQDDPPITSSEKHRVRVYAQCFNKYEVQLTVLSLKKNWNPNIFYKDLEMIANDINEQDYNPPNFRDLSVQIQRPSKVIAKLPWRFSEGVVLDVLIRTMCCKTKYLKKIKVSKANNKPITTYTHYETRISSNRDSDDEETEGTNDEISEIVVDSDIRKVKEYGGKKIFFTPKEVKSLSHTSDRGIDIIATKPLSIDPVYHFQPSYLVKCAYSKRKDNKLFFGTLLNKCASKGLMIVCAVTLRNYSTKKLCTMIPVEEKGGFYLYRLPAKENVRKDGLSARLDKFIHNGEEKPNTRGVDLLTEVIKRLKIQYHPTLFPNPKLQTQHQNVETLALDLELGERPEDETLPHVEEMQERVGHLMERYKEMINYMPPEEPSGKKRKITQTILTKEQVLKNIKTNKLDSFNVPELKAFLKSENAKVSGTKAELIARIKSIVKS